MVSVYVRFSMYFSIGLLSMIAIIVAGTLFGLGYAVCQLFFRFQYKMNIVFILMQQPQLDFNRVNKLCVYSLRVVMMLIGGFGWLSLLYIDI